MATKFNIEKGIPIPKKKGKRSKYPFREMEVGDSFVVNVNPEKKDARMMANSLGTSLKYMIKHNDEMKDKEYTIRIVNPSTIRCWRVK